MYESRERDLRKAYEALEELCLDESEILTDIAFATEEAAGLWSDHDAALLMAEECHEDGRYDEAGRHTSDARDLYDDASEADAALEYLRQQYSRVRAGIEACLDSIDAAREAVRKSQVD